jgi:hypothetical protein
LLLWLRNWIDLMVVFGLNLWLLCLGIAGLNWFLIFLLVGLRLVGMTAVDLELLIFLEFFKVMFFDHAVSLEFFANVLLTVF